MDKRTSDNHRQPVTTARGNIIGADGVVRPPWAMRSELEREYFDEEWGRPVITESGLLERICLEGFQSGLSWATILRKRRAFRDHFFLFDATRITQMSAEQREAALADPALIRNPRKHAAIYRNAEATVALREDPELQELPEGHPARKILGGAARRLPAGLPVLIWSYASAEHQPPSHVAEMPSESEESVAMAAELKRRGFTFVGPTTCYALMQAIGMVDDRVPEPEAEQP
ncbi:DNA-3-methyladenine glycosylase I [Corynebacterium sp. MSK039]|uniref:DNA-3-methyladenine glycosylase I n=1 Tax=Corynebacterium sp. MSK039 TaxID=3050193 RepID=UPI002550426B|nr:DNA-3-methyladenine glycosylase I [Corynebacterium sp. MSK039]MDK8791794.1 DNA-3-methyladenine glycosylase I [Corynebacterium sp. MSK039]